MVSHENNHGVSYWVPIILNAVLIIGAMLGVWIANDRRLTVLEQQLSHDTQRIEKLEAVTAKVVESQSDAIRALDRVTILMDFYLGPNAKKGAK